jgi:1-acyl-sn-glycerol-3-phosphate acyltransferase
MKHWRYDTAEDLEQPMIERLRNFPREPDILVYLLRSFAAVSMRAWLRVYHRFEITGLENLPASGSFVLVANHSSHLDAPCWFPPCRCANYTACFRRPPPIIFSKASHAFGLPRW